LFITFVVLILELSKVSYAVLLSKFVTVSYNSFNSLSYFLNTVNYYFFFSSLLIRE